MELDFLEKYSGTIDVPQRRLVLWHAPNTSVSIYAFPSTNREPNLYAALSETVTIPPYSELETLSQVDSFSHSMSTWLIEDNLSSYKRINATVARAIVTPSSSIVVRLINPTNSSVTVHKGTHIASITALSNEGILMASQVSNIPSISDNKKQLLHKIAYDLPHLSTAEKEKFYTLLISFADVFPDNEDDLGHTEMVKHHIDTGSATPIRQPVRQVPKHKQHEAQKLIQRMLDKNIISPSQSPWSSPVILVRKKDGSLRFCVDYRKVNSVTRKDAYPLPRIDDTLNTLAGSSWFTTLDLLSGYWQLEVAENDREKTAFSTRSGLFHFNVMPFGLCNAPASFQRLMDMVLSGVLWEVCLVYIDDVIIMGRDFNSHLTNIASVLHRLRNAGLKVKPTKCDFFKQEVMFLGHVISEKGISTDKSKVDKVVSWPTPTNLQQLQQFLGLASYYRHFIQNFATISKPLHRLTEKKTPFHWSSECADSFNQLKKLLTSAPILSFPDFSHKFILDTDASNDGIGAVLSQHKNGKEYVIAYASRSPTKAERNYSVTRRELLAVVTFTNHFRQYLLGQQFLLRTDHHSLTWLTNFKNPEGQLARWLEKLSEYSFEIVHRSGHKHNNADSLSRYPHKDTTLIAAVPDSPLSLFSYSPSDIRDFQLQDIDIEPVQRAKEQNIKPAADSLTKYSIRTRRLFQLWDQLQVVDGILFRVFYSPESSATWQQLVVPSSL